MLLGVLLAGNAACHPAVRLEPSIVHGALAPEVDSVVVRPFEKAARVDLNAADLAALTQHLREALDARERLHSFAAPPTLLPNTVVLAGRLDRFAITERKGDGLTLRTIELEAELRVLPPQGDTPQRVLRRAVAWQRLYPGTVSGLPLDLDLAVRELSEQLAQALAPQLPGPGQRLWDGRDPRTGVGTSHAALLKGNQFAGAGFFEKAIQSWQRVIFDPSLQAGATLYQVTPATLQQLRNAGLSEDVLGRMQPLVGPSPKNVAEFRRALHAAVGGILPNEGLVLTAADTRTANTHRNLSAAHANLATVYELQGRDDLAAYHWAHAWAHNPDPVLLERWHALQSRRRLLLGDLTDQQAVELYLRIPPPSTAGVMPGAFERTVVPPPAFAEAESGPNGANGAPAQPAPSNPATSAAAPQQQPEQPQQPGPPASGAAPGAGTNTEASTPGRAAGSGPSGSAGAPSAAVPAAGTAPAAQ